MRGQSNSAGSSIIGRAIWAYRGLAPCAPTSAQFARHSDYGTPRCQEQSRPSSTTRHSGATRAAFPWSHDPRRSGTTRANNSSSPKHFQGRNARPCSDGSSRRGTLSERTRSIAAASARRQCHPGPLVFRNLSFSFATVSVRIALTFHRIPTRCCYTCRVRLSINNISMRFGPRVLFEDVTTTFMAGRRYAITADVHGTKASPIAGALSQKSSRHGRQGDEHLPARSSCHGESKWSRGP